jgi:ADP-ribose pyrophosphatase
MKITTIKSKTIFHGRAFKVRQDEIQFPNGHATLLDIVEHKGAVTILPVDEANHIWFIKQYRHAAGGIILELPAGTLEEGEDPEACALREIREEIGMSASKIEKLGEFYMAPGYTTEYLYAYLATGLNRDPLPGDEDEIITIEKIPAEEAYSMAESGQVHDAKTLATLLLALRRLIG